MDHVPGAKMCYIWNQKHYALCKMIDALEDINKTTGASVLWTVLHENHFRDFDLNWVKEHCSSNLAGSAAERLAIAICDSLLELPQEERMMVIYRQTYGITAKYGYCIRNYSCNDCLLSKTRESRIEEEEKARYEARLSDKSGLPDETGDSGEGC